MMHHEKGGVLGSSRVDERYHPNCSETMHRVWYAGVKEFCKKRESAVSKMLRYESLNLYLPVESLRGDSYSCLWKKLLTVISIIFDNKFPDFSPFCCVRVDLSLC